jgi:dTDP-4-amino-4,6-dideoxygalactose transaminase
MSRRAFEVVDAFEQAVAAYTGARYAVAVDSCTNAIFLSLLWLKHVERFRPEECVVLLPKRTYVGVAQAARNAGYRIDWDDEAWSGMYRIWTQGPTPLYDAARRFTSGMYEPTPPGSLAALVCVSFQANKILPIGRGGAILTDDLEAAEWFRRARFDGRTEGRPAGQDAFTVPGWHMYMPPDAAARGLWLMQGLAKDNPDLPNDDYPDLSRQAIFR